MNRELRVDRAGTAASLSADEQAVRDVITREIDAFFARDFDGWADCYLHSPRLRSVMMSHDLGLDLRVGWEAFAAGTRLHFETSEPLPADLRYHKEIEQVEVVGDCAWLACRARSNANTCMMQESYETWVLERHAGEWKVVCVDVMACQSTASRERRIAVDGEGRVVGLDSEAQRRLDQHPAFVIRAGRLHARDAALDAELQAAMGRAGALHGFFEQAAYANLEGQRFAYPLVMERPNAEGFEVVLLTVEDRLTYLEFGTEAATSSRVDVAAMVFGLSEGQQKVAQGVVAGQSLPAIAAELGISPATAKTHLQRVYQKTGTATMTALVRTLLSVG